MSDVKLVSISEAAKRLNVPRKRLYTMHDRGQLSSVTVKMGARDFVNLDLLRSLLKLDDQINLSAWNAEATNGDAKGGSERR